MKPLLYKVSGRVTMKLYTKFIERSIIKVIKGMYTKLLRALLKSAGHYKVNEGMYT
jgi:hypothetical protein